MFMSYAALSHVEVRLGEIADGTKVTLRHRVMGFLDAGHRDGVGAGRRLYLDNVRKDLS